MKLNPLDIRRQQFARKTFGGYDTEEVDGFLKQIADQWEGVLDELRSATDRAQETENKLRHYERVEMALQEALESTRESGRRAEALAEQKARLITDEAELRARQIVQNAERDRHDLRQDLVTLTSRQTEIGARLRGFLLSELEILAQFQGDDPVGFIKLQPANPPAEQRSLDAPVEPTRLVSHDADRYGADRYGADAGAADTHDPAPEMPRKPELPAPVAPRPEPARSEPVATEPVATERVAPEPVATGPAISEAHGSEPAAPAWPSSAPASAPTPWDDAPAGALPVPVAWDDTPVDAPPPTSWDDAQATSPVWPPTPAPPAPGIPTWAADLPEASPAEPATASWDLRSLVTGGEGNVAGSEAERERIRRILDDLD